MPRLREKKRLREQRLLGIRTGIPKYIPAKLELRGFKLKFYDLTDTKIGEIGSDVKQGRISTVNFELLPLGCGAFSFVIDEMPKMLKYEIDVEDDDLVGYWPFDEGSGMVAYDKSKYGNDGDLMNMEEDDWINGKINKALIFDGIDEYINVPDSLSLRPEEFTIAFWVKPGTMSNWNRWISKNLYSTERRGWMVLRNSSLGSYIYIALFDDNSVARTSFMVPYSENEWAHFAFTYSYPWIRAYKNGVEVGTGVNVGSWIFSPSTEPLRIARDYSALMFNGILDEILFYKEALSADEIKALYEFKVGKYVDVFDIAYRTRVDIHPYLDASPWFTGFIQNLPQPGQERPYEYTGFGFYEQLDWVTVTGSYESQDIAEIVKDIIENIVAPNTQIVYNASKVETTGYVVTKVDFDHTYAKDAIQTLADMAQGHEFGVDDIREFYFRPIDTDVNYSYWVGKHCQDIEIEKEPHAIRNKLYIKSGEIQADGSNIIGNVKDDPSIAAYGLREEVISVPEAIDSDDAVRWANQILANKKDPKIKAKIKNIIFDKTKTKMTASGKIRVTTYEGTEYQLSIKKIDYSISSAGILGDIELE